MTRAEKNETVTRRVRVGLRFPEKTMLAQLQNLRVGLMPIGHFSARAIASFEVPTPTEENR